MSAMGYRLGCPNCNAWTSAVFRAYADGKNCPYCGAGINTVENRRHYYEQLPDDHQRPPAADDLNIERMRSEIATMAANTLTPIPVGEYVPLGSDAQHQLDRIDKLLGLVSGRQFLASETPIEDIDEFLNDIHNIISGDA